MRAAVFDRKAVERLNEEEVEREVGDYRREEPYRPTPRGCDDQRNEKEDEAIIHEANIAMKRRWGNRQQPRCNNGCKDTYDRISSAECCSHQLEPLIK
jgi:hypothetical protein